MSTLYTDLYILLRTLIDDSEQYYEDTINGDGTTTQWALTEDKVVIDVNSRVDTVTVNGVANTSYTVDSNRGWITFTSAPANASVIVVKYRSYRSFTDTELLNFIQLAVGRLVMSGYCTWDVTSTTIDTTLTIKDKYLVSSVVAILINPNARVTWETGEIRYSSMLTGKSGDDLIKDMINQAKLMGTCNDLIVEITGINNVYNIDNEEREDEENL